MGSLVTEIQVCPLWTRCVLEIRTLGLKGNITVYYMALPKRSKPDPPYQLHQYYAAICLEKGTLSNIH